LETYIKTNFAETLDTKLNKKIGYSSITDEEYKLETHILNFNNDEYYKMNLNKGDKIETIGVVQTTGMHLHLVIKF